jgi:hypothetical protein
MARDVLRREVDMLCALGLKSQEVAEKGENNMWKRPLADSSLPWMSISNGLTLSFLIRKFLNVSG